MKKTKKYDRILAVPTKIPIGSNYNPKGFFMKLYNKGLYTRASLILTLAYFATFLSFYFSYVLFYDKSFFSYLWYFVQKSTFLLLPLVSATLILIEESYCGMKSALIKLIPLSFAKAIYSLPYYYLYFVYDIYDSIEALSFAFIQSLVEVLLLYIFTFIIFFIMRSLLKAFNKSTKSHGEILSKRTVLNFSDPVSLTFMISAVLCFLYFFVVEIVDTVSIISRYSARLRGGEIAYMVFSYFFDVLLLAVHYLVLAYVKNRIINYRLREADDE